MTLNKMSELSDEDIIEEIVVVIKLKNVFRWFRCDRDWWVLDWDKWDLAFVEAGCDADTSGAAERFGIPVVDETTIEQFISHIQQYEIKKQDLTNELVMLLPDAESWWDIGDRLFPIMYADFDRRHVVAFYYQGAKMEHYVPDGWTSEFEDFATKYPEKDFPTSEKFWIKDGFDMLEELNRRGEKLT